MLWVVEILKKKKMNPNRTLSLESETPQGYPLRVAEHYTGLTN
jgi:hypothetical protein